MIRFPKAQTNTHMVAQLRKDILKKFGKNVKTATDCDALAVLISEHCAANISSQTLRRFFRLIKSSSAPSQYTLNLLAKFCGYDDFADFCRSYRGTELEEFFANTHKSDESYWEKSEELCRKISDSPELLVRTHHRLMGYPMARKYFIENHPLRDLICTVYSEYFSAYLKYNTSAEAKIFAYGFLFKSAFFHQNYELMDLYFKKVKETQLSPAVHVIPAGLKYGIQLLYADATGNEYLFRKFYNEMKNVREDYIEASQKSVCSFEYTVLECLVFTERTEEMRFLLENNTFQKNQDADFIPSRRKETHAEVWKILTAFAYQKMGETDKSKRCLADVNLDHLGIGWKKYYSIMYYFVKLMQTEESRKQPIITTLKKLISETYFTYYGELLDNYLQNPDSVKNSVAI